MRKKYGIFCLIFCLASVLGMSHVFALKVSGAGKTLNVLQAKTMAMSHSSAYRKLKNKKILAEVKYQEAVKSIKLKKKNMSTFRWTPLLSFKFPEKPDLAEEFEFTYKPIQIQSEINSIRHEMSVVKYKVYEETGNKFTEVYTLQEIVAFCQEQLSHREETLKRNRARLLVGEAAASDIDAMEKSVRALENKTAEKMRSFEKAKKKLSEFIGFDVSSGYQFLTPYVETSMQREDLGSIQEHALKQDQTYYEAKAELQLKRIALDTNYSLMRNQYGKKMDRLTPFIQTVKTGGTLDSDVLKAQYDSLLEEVDAPWTGTKKILFIKIPKEWFKGQISGVRYVEDDPYTLYTNILEYQEAAAEEKNARKELLDSVEDSYDAVITARNAYQVLKQETDLLRGDVDAAMLLNKAGDLSFDELSSQQEMYEDSQMVLLEALSTYTQALSVLDGLSCGAAESMMYASGSNMQAVSGGESFVTEELAEGAMYQIRTSVEDNMFEVGIFIPEQYELEVTSFELWIDNVQIGERTDKQQRISHLALDKENAEKVVIRLYNKDQFIDDCEIDPTEYEGPLKVVKTYKMADRENLTVAGYQTSMRADGLIKLVISPTAEKPEIAFYTVETQAGKRLFEEQLIPIGEPFLYLSLLKGDLKKLRVRFYDASKAELYLTEFDVDSLSLKIIFR